MRTTRSMTFDHGTSSLSGWLPTAISKDMLPMSATQLRESILKHLEFTQGKDLANASVFDMRMALTMAIRDRVIEPWFRATRATYAAQSKRVYYLSMEFLIGRLLEDAVMNIGLTESAHEAVTGLGFDFHTVLNDEPDAALGNGGLGVSPRVSSTPCRHWAARLTAMASAMSTACFVKALAPMAVRSKQPKTGCVKATAGSLNAPKRPSASDSAVT